MRIVIGGLGAGGVFTPRSAAACEPMPCDRGYVLPESGSVPENASGILVFLNPTGPALPNITVSSAAGPVPAEVARRKRPSDGWSVFEVRPKAGFKSGQSFELGLTDPCKYVGPGKLTAKVEVTPNAPPPSKLGQLKSSSPKSGQLKVGTASGSCSTQEAAVWLDIELELDPSAKPWRDLFEYSTFLDGKPWRKSDSINQGPPAGGSWIGRGRDRVYALCPGEHGFPGASEGKHSVLMKAQLGDKLELASAPLEIEINCGVASTPATPSPPPATAQAPAPATTNSGGPQPTKGSHCGCRAVHSSAGHTPLLGLLLAAAACARCRRGRRFARRV